MTSQKDNKVNKTQSGIQGHNAMALSVRSGQSPAFRYVFKKSERIAAAVHLMTDYVPNGEPIRVRLRECVLSLLTHIRLLNDGSYNNGHGTVREALGCIDEVTGLLDVALSCGFISAMNHEVLVGECDKLAQLLSERADEFGGASAAVGQTFFEVPEEASVAGAGRGSKVAQTGESGTDVVRTAPKAATRSVSSGTASATPSKPAKQRHGQRREAILSLVRERGRINVRDAAEVITDCSEKTLQRELLALVSEGALIKEGERRWSTYRLPQ